MTAATKIYAFCGVDGAGKSTLVDELERRGMVAGAAFVRRPKEPTSNSMLLRRYFRRDYNDGRDWIQGAFADAMAISLSFEFLDHYDRNVAPLLGKYPIVVSDRYALCFGAYLHSIGSALDPAGLFGAIQQPTHTFYVHVSPRELVRRHHHRGGIRDDEDPEVMARFDRSYRELLVRERLAFSLIDNEGALDDSLRAIARKLAELGT